MKSRIRWSVIALTDISAVIIMMLLGDLLYPEFGRTHYGKHGFEGKELFYLFVIAILLYHLFFTIRKIELTPIAIKLRGFASSSYSLHKNTIPIAYEDIYSIKALRVPIFGVIRISFRTNHFRKNFSISCIYTKHKKVFEELCKNVKAANPDAFIDKRLHKFTEA